MTQALRLRVIGSEYAVREALPAQEGGLCGGASRTRAPVVVGGGAWDALVSRLCRSVAT